jgi:DNA polymerase III delta prime subunit
MMKRFEGTDTYIATDDLMMAVNAALTLERPLLVKGEPGTGKTMLAIEIARSIGRPLFEWHIKSTTKAQHGLYEYDAVSRLRDSQLGDARVHDIRNYILRGMLWSAFVSDAPAVLLIDEVDKADIEFPNDLLRELDRMEFYVYETQELVKAKHRPLGVFRDPRGAGAEEEALDLRAPRLAEAPHGGRHPARGAAQPGHPQDHSSAAWGAAQERAGRASLRAARLHVQAKELMSFPRRRESRVDNSRCSSNFFSS